MSTTKVTAGQIMDRVARLLNDPNRTDYTYAVQIPFLNMAIEEFSDLVSEANSPFSNLTSGNEGVGVIIVPVGISFLIPADSSSSLPSEWPRYPIDLIEIQEIGERPQGNTGAFHRLPRKEFADIIPATSSLLYWTLERGIVRFNPNGANIPIEVQLRYIYQGIPYAVNEGSIIDYIGSRTFLAYKTAAFCAMFIGENETRAKVLEDRAEDALERTINISNKGRQQIVTRHRPFRAAYKMRGGY